MRPRKPGRDGWKKNSALVFAWFELNPSTFLHDISLHRRHFRIVGGEVFAFQRVANAPVDHLPKLRHLTQLFLKFWVRFRVGIDGRWRKRHRRWC